MDCADEELLTLDLTAPFSTDEGQVPWRRINFPENAPRPPAVQQGALFNGNNSKLFLFEGQVPPEQQETRESEIWEFDTATQSWSGLTDSWEWAGNGRSFPRRRSRGTPIEIPSPDGTSSRGFYIGGARVYQNATFAGWHYPDNDQVVELDLTLGQVTRQNDSRVRQSLRNHSLAQS